MTEVSESTDKAITEVSESTDEATKEAPKDDNKEQVKEFNKFYRLRFRRGEQIHSASSKIKNLMPDEVVMVQTEHGLEPAYVHGTGMNLSYDEFNKPPAFFTIVRRGARDEIGKFENLVVREKEAYDCCQEWINKLGLTMKLIRVERFFNGSKVIFYFAAENRVDFRDLVKELVQEFRTRVEMRQIGVRHETQMLGGLGCCGRELCCSLFMSKFVPVSIKMAKEQNLPLNPSKISGSCNRLLCCLTHEFDTYKYLKKDMPKVGRLVSYEDKQYKVSQCNVLNHSVSITSVEDKSETKVLHKDEFAKIKVLERPKKKEDSKKSSGKSKSKKHKGQKEE